MAFNGELLKFYLLSWLDGWIVGWWMLYNVSLNESLNCKMAMAPNGLQFAMEDITCIPTHQTHRS